MKELKRRNFLKLSGLSLVPALLPGLTASATAFPVKNDTAANTVVSFTDDGVHYAPDEYIAKLQEISQKDAIKADVYGQAIMRAPARGLRV